MASKNRNKYGRGNLQLMPPEKVYIPKVVPNDELSYLNLGDYLILAGLIKGDYNQRKHILDSIKSHETNYFYYKQFPYFLFQAIVKWLDEDMDRPITPEMFLDQIFEFYPIIWGVQPKWRSVKNEIEVCCQFYYMKYKPEDIDRAIELSKDKPMPSWPLKAATIE